MRRLKKRFLLNRTSQEVKRNIPISYIKSIDEKNWHVLLVNPGFKEISPLIAFRKKTNLKQIIESNL